MTRAGTATEPGSLRRGRQREAVKAESRRRLIDAALQVLDEEGEAALTTTRVSKAAGLAQPSFYVHFDNMDSLLRSVIDDVLDEWRSATVEARRASRAVPDDAERFRATFRTPMQQLITHPQIFRIALRNRLDVPSPIGIWTRQLFDDLRDELVHDLEAAGFAHSRAADRRRLLMIADGIMGMTTELVLGHLDGRYSNLEEMIDVLVAFSNGYFALLPASRTRP